LRQKNPAVCRLHQRDSRVVCCVVTAFKTLRDRLVVHGFCVGQLGYAV